VRERAAGEGRYRVRRENMQFLFVCYSSVFLALRRSYGDCCLKSTMVQKETDLRSCYLLKDLAAQPRRAHSPAPHTDHRAQTRRRRCRGTPHTGKPAQSVAAPIVAPAPTGAACTRSCRTVLAQRSNPATMRFRTIPCTKGLSTSVIFQRAAGSGSV
jgi:hypothetical protein